MRSKLMSNVPTNLIQYKNIFCRTSISSFSKPNATKKSLVLNYPNYNSFSTESTNKAKESLNHCINLVQKRDRVGYLTTLLLPHTTRSSIFSIRAFNAELASIKDNTSTNSSSTNNDVLTGGTANIPLRIRFQFWREILDQIYDSKEQVVNPKYYTENNPMIQLLQESIYKNNLTRVFLEKMISAREYDLDIQQFGTMQEIVDYGDDTFGSLYYLSLECMNVRDDKADLVASHLSASYSIIQALQSTQYRILRNEISIPAEIMQKYSLTGISLLPQQPSQDQNSDESIILHTITPELKQAIKEMINEAKYHLYTARKMQNDIPREGKLCLLLPAVVSMKYLDLVENKYKYDIFHPDIETELLDWKSMLYLGRTWLTGVL